MFDRDVTAECGKRDRYKRQVCVVVIDGKDANLAQVAAGMAWWYGNTRREQSAEQRADYEAAEDAARSAQIGLWRNAEPVAPWEWRSTNREKYGSSEIRQWLL